MFHLLDRPNPRGPFYYPSRNTCKHGVKPDKLPHLAVVHTAESLPDFVGADTSGETLARYASTTDRRVSWHSTVDSDGTIPMLPDNYVAFHVVGYNSCGVGMEIATKAHLWASAAQDRPKWYADIMGMAANQVAWWCRAHNLEPIRLTKAQADKGGRGVIGHHALDPGRRSDPGAAFAWTRFMADVETRLTPTVQPPPAKYLYPRRFGEVFQVDDRHHGTLAQQQSVRDALSPPYGSKYHALLQSFDRFYNRTYPGRHHVNIEVKDFAGDTRLGLAGTVSFALSDKLAVSTIGPQAVHEFGHVLDNTDFITQQDREWFMSALGVVPDWNQYREAWADAVKDWRYGVSWSALDGILLKP